MSSLNSETLVGKDENIKKEFEYVQQDCNSIRNEHCFTELDKLGFEEELLKSRRKCEDLERQITRLKEDQIMFSDKTKIVQSEYTKLCAEQSKMTNEKNKKISELNEKLSTLQKQVVERDDILIVCQKNIKSSKMKVAEKDKEIAKLKGQKVEADHTIEELRCKHAEVDLTVEEFRRRGLAADQTVEDLLRQKLVADQTVEDLLSQKLVADQTMEELRHKVLVSDQTVEALRIKQVEANQTVEEFRRKELVADQAMKELKHKELVADQTVEGLNKTVEGLNKTLEGLNKTVEELNKTVKELRQKNMEGCQTIEELMRQKLEADEVSEINKRRYEALVARITRVEQEFADYLKTGGRKLPQSSCKTIEEGVNHNKAESPPQVGAEPGCNPPQVDSSGTNRENGSKILRGSGCSSQKACPPTVDGDMVEIINLDDEANPVLLFSYAPKRKRNTLRNKDGDLAIDGQKEKQIQKSTDDNSNLPCTSNQVLRRCEEKTGGVSCDPRKPFEKSDGFKDDEDSVDSDESCTISYMEYLVANIGSQAAQNMEVSS